MVVVVIIAMVVAASAIGVIPTTASWGIHHIDVMGGCCFVGALAAGGQQAYSAICYLPPHGLTLHISSPSSLIAICKRVAQKSQVIVFT